MFRVGRLFVMLSLLGLTALAGVATGILIAPASGEETRLEVSAFFERHAYLKDNMKRSAQAVAGAVEYVREQVLPAAEAADQN